MSELTPEQQEAVNKAVEERVKKFLKEEKRLTSEIADNYERGAKYQRQKGEDIEKAQERILKESDIEARKLRLKLDQAKLSGDAMAAAESLYDLEEELFELQSVSIGKRTEAQEERIKFLAEEAAAQRANGVEAKKYSEADKKAKKELDGLMASIGRKSLFFTQAEGTFVGTLFNVASTFKEANEKGEVFTTTLGKYFNRSTFATSIVTKTVESTIAMVKALDQANAQFAAATGMGDKYTATLAEMRTQGNTLGVTFQNAGSALKGLTENMVGFVNMSEQAKVSLAMNVAQFERIGIDANTSAQLINNFTLNMGKSEQQAMAMSKELALMGQSAGISASKMSRDFQAAFKSLAVYGDKSIEVFQGLASAARAAGVEVATLTSLAGRFDTFSQSAETVGKLNSLLGSQLSSTEMLMMTEDQRIETLVQQVQVGETTFKDMNKFQQMAIANAAGIDDMNEAQRIFGMNMKDYKKYRKDMERQENIQKRFNEAVEATIPLQEKMQIFIANFAQAIQPLLSFVEGLVDGLIFLTSNKIVMGIVQLVSAFYLLKFAMTGGLKVIRGMGLATKGLTAAQKTQETMNHLLLEQQKTNNILSGNTIVKNEIESNSHIKNSRSKNISAVGSKNLGNASKSAGKSAGAGALGMLKFALAVLMIGAGIGIAAFGIAAMVTSFIDLATIGPEAVATLTSFSFALATLMASGALGLFGAGGLMLGMMAVKKGMQEIGQVLADNIALQEGLENLALVTTGKGAAAMKAGGTALAGDLKAAVNAAMTQKLEVIIKLKDSALKDMVEDVVVNSISNDGRVAKAVAKVAG
jgi:hypothetical protein